MAGPPPPLLLPPAAAFGLRDSDVDRLLSIAAAATGQPSSNSSSSSSSSVGGGGDGSGESDSDVLCGLLELVTETAGRVDTLRELELLLQLQARAAGPCYGHALNTM
jgi:hypothetical protein